MILLLLTACTAGFSDVVDVSGIDVGETGIPSTHACLGEEVRTTLADWLHATWLVAYGAPGAASSDAVPSFYQLPGVPAAAWFSVDLASPCATAQDRDALCTGGVCYQVECLDGGGWVNHIENDPDVPDTTVTDFGGWTVDRGRTPTTWDGVSASLAVEYDVRALTSPQGADYTFAGVATFDGDLTLEVEFPSIYADGALTVVAGGQSATLTAAQQLVGEWDGTTVAEVGDCF